MIELKQGDIVATSADTLLGLLIRIFSRVAGEEDSRVNHVGVVVTNGDYRSVKIVEALHFVRRHGLSDQYGLKATGVRVWRHRHLTDVDRQIVAKVADEYVGRPYGYLKIAAHALDRWLFGGKFVVRKLFGYSRFPICSFVVAQAYAMAVGYGFGVAVREAQPDDIDDWCRAHPKDWEQVTPLLPVGEWEDWQRRVVAVEELKG